MNLYPIGATTQGGMTTAAGSARSGRLNSGQPAAVGEAGGAKSQAGGGR